MTQEPRSVAESMASSLYRHQRDHTSRILTTSIGSYFVLTDTNDLIESAWTRPQTGPYMLKPNLLNWVDLHPITRQVVL